MKEQGQLIASVTMRFKAPFEEFSGTLRSYIPEDESSDPYGREPRTKQRRREVTEEEKAPAEEEEPNGLPRD